MFSLPKTGLPHQNVGRL